MKIRTLFKLFSLVTSKQYYQEVEFIVEKRKILEDVVKDNPDISLHPDVIIQGYLNGRMDIGKGVHVNAGSVIALGSENNGYGRLEIGEGTWIGEYNNFRMAESSPIKIGERCLISQFCSFIAANHIVSDKSPIKNEPVDLMKDRKIVVGNDVWIGAGSVILPGVSVGDGAVIGANSCVTKSVPSFEIWAGNPAIKLRTR